MAAILPLQIEWRGLCAAEVRGASHAFSQSPPSRASRSFAGPILKGGDGSVPAVWAGCARRKICAASAPGRRFASRVALLQILPDVVDRVAQQFAHATPGELRRALAYSLENGPMLMQAVVLNLRGALPAQFEHALEGGADEAAKRGEKVVSGPLENAHVEVEIGPDEIARAVPEVVHAAI